MEIKKIKLKRWHTKDGIAECVFMDNDEFNKIRMDKNSPDLVFCTDKNKLFYNSFTCYNSYRYGGTCNCINHRTKRWDDFTNQLIEVLE